MKTEASILSSKFLLGTALLIGSFLAGVSRLNQIAHAPRADKPAFMAQLVIGRLDDPKLSWIRGSTERTIMSWDDLERQPWTLVEFDNEGVLLRLEYRGDDILPQMTYNDKVGIREAYERRMKSMKGSMSNP